MHAALRVVLTGASGVVGSAIARRLADEGAILVLAGRNRQKLDALKTTLKTKNRVGIWCGDLTAVGACTRLTDFAISVMGGIDVLIHCAGVFHFSAFGQLTPERIDEILNINLRIPVHLTQAALPTLKKNNHAVVLIMSSLAGAASLPGGACYAATKWALNGFAHSLREELRKGSVRLCTLSPCQVDVLSPYSEGHIRVVTPDVLAEIAVLIITASWAGSASLDLTIH